jgi:DNA-binding transcriptional LysR family regulator
MKEKLSPYLHHLTLRQLRGLPAVVAAGSISAAARSLHLSPPAVSLQIRELEKSTATPLLERSGNQLIPTKGGEVILELANGIDKALKEAGNKLDEIIGIDRGIVSVGVVSTARYFAPTVLAAFNQLNPGVKLQLQVGNRQEVINKLENLELDFAITGRPPNQFDVVSEYIGRHPQILIAAPQNAFAGKSRIALSKLIDQTFLLREPGSGTRALTDEFFIKNKCFPESGIEFGSNETIKQAVIAGMGIAIISAHTVAAELESGRLISLDVKGMPIIKKWFVVKHKNKRLLPSSKALWNFFSQSGKNYLPN